MPFHRKALCGHPRLHISISYPARSHRPVATHVWHVTSPVARGSHSRTAAEAMFTFWCVLSYKSSISEGIITKMNTNFSLFFAGIWTQNRILWVVKLTRITEKCRAVLDRIVLYAKPQLSMNQSISTSLIKSFRLYSLLVPDSWKKAL